MEMGEAVAKMNRLREGNRWEKSERQGGERDKKKEMEEPTRQAVGSKTSWVTFGEGEKTESIAHPLHTKVEAPS